MIELISIGFMKYNEQEESAERSSPIARREKAMNGS
jgi:hypothetical protein